MKKKSGLLVALLIMCSAILCACNGKEYYENAHHSKLETFTSVTGVECSLVEENEVGTIYCYIMDVNADTFTHLSAYKSYLENDYGFEHTMSQNGMEIYSKDEHTIFIYIYELNDSTIQLMICPNPVEMGNTSSGNVEEDYEKMVELVEAGSYSEAIDFYNNSVLSDESEGYLDSKTYWDYARAMEKYEEGVYGNAYDILSENCRGFMDADSVIKDIEDEVFFLNGVYINKSLDYEQYLVIYNGNANFEFDKDKLSDKVMYIYPLYSYTFTTGENAYGVSDYLITTISNNGDSFVLGGAPGSGQTTFSGAYERTDIPVPAAK